MINDALPNYQSTRVHVCFKQHDVLGEDKATCSGRTEQLSDLINKANHYAVQLVKGIIAWYDPVGVITNRHLTSSSEKTRCVVIGNEAHTGKRSGALFSHTALQTYLNDI